MKKAGSMTTNTSTKARVSILKKDDINEADDDDKAAASQHKPKIAIVS